MQFYGAKMINSNWKGNEEILDRHLVKNSGS